MKRRRISCKVAGRDILPRWIEGEPTVFGLVITPWLSHRDTFETEEGYAITDPTTGYMIVAGWSKREALINLRDKARELRREHGSFRATVDVARRNVVIMQAARQA